MKDSMGDRMKDYERIGKTQSNLFPFLPGIIRLDGKSFHNFTKGLERPFDKRLHNLMCDLTKFLMKECGAKVGYTQSDEISLMLFQKDHREQLHFGGKIQKLNSVLAASASVFFNKKLIYFLPEKADQSPVFDCRCFNVPNKIEVYNYFLWREKDATRNSIQMLGQHYFSHRQLQKKSCNQIQDMLHEEYDINWNDCPSEQKRGSYFYKKDGEEISLFNLNRLSSYENKEKVFFSNIKGEKNE